MSGLSHVIQRTPGRRYKAVIYIAGDYAQACQALRERCAVDGDCWCVEPCDYVYTGGKESGVKLTRIAYPRFEAHISAGDIQDKGEKMARHLLLRLHQRSCTVVGPLHAVYLTRDKPGP